MGVCDSEVEGVVKVECTWVCVWVRVKARKEVLN